MKICQTLTNNTKKLNDSKTPQLDAEVLLAHILRKPREWVLAHAEFKLSEKQVSDFEDSVSRRAEGEPVAFIVGYKDFYGLRFEVDRNVLIPRPETELMVEYGFKLLYKELRNLLRNKDSEFKIHNSKFCIADVGTGSGCVIISLFKNLRNLKSPSFPLLQRRMKEGFHFIGTDISKDALEVARKNTKTHGIENEITFLRGNLLEPVMKNFQLPVTSYQLLVTANLPYLSKDLYQSAEKDVKDFEPRLALESGKDGLDHHRRLFDQIKMLRVLCYVLCEISPEQKDIIKKEILNRFPKAKIKFHKDLAGKWRLVEIEIQKGSY